MDDFEKFYEAEHLRVVRAVFAFCGRTDIALDSTQEAFARALARWPRLRNKDWRAGWVISTAMNQCRRSLKKEPASGLDSAPEERSHPLLESELKLDLMHAVRSLPLRQRQCVVLFYLADLTPPIVGELLGISEGAVKSHLSRARSSLRRAMEVSDV